MLSAARVPLSHRSVVPVESAALGVMAVTQLVASAWLAPFLFRDRYASLAVIASAGPMLVGAALLADVPVVRCLGPGLYLLVWMTSLTFWTRATAGSIFLGMLAAGWAVGAVVLRYLHVEFAAGSSILPPSAHRAFSPIDAVLSLTRQPGLGKLFMWGPVIGILLTGIISSLSFSRQVIHRLIPR